MAVPSNMVLTPAAIVTKAMGETIDATTEFYQLVAGSVFVVYSQVPLALGLTMRQSKDPDTDIALQLAGYPKRVVAV